MRQAHPVGEGGSRAAQALSPIKRSKYRFRDLFRGIANPMPSAVARVVTGSRFFLDERGLRGGGQVFPGTWAASDVRYPTLPQSRENGLTMLALHTVEDADNPYAFGFSTSPTAIDPRTDGHGILIEDKSFKVITPGAKILLDADGRMTRPMQYLVATVLLDEGAAVYISTFGTDTGAGMTYPAGIPQYPTMRLLYVTRNGTTAALFPYISALDVVSGGYSGGHRFQDLRIVPVADWAGVDALCAAADRFTRANSALTLGVNWTSDNGTFGISSNRAYAPSVSGFGRAWMESGVSDFILTGRMPIPANGYNKYGFTLRRQDANNFIRLWFNDNIAQLQTWVEGGFGATITNVAYAMTANNTYRVTLIVSGNRYRLYINDIDLYGSWVEDTNSRFVNATKHGLYILEDTGYTNARWDDFAVYPLTATAPIELQSGAKPTIFTPGSTIASDTFTDANGTRLNAHTPNQGNAWTENVGVWTIQGNRLECSTPVVDAINYCTMDIGTTRFEASCSFRLDAGETEQYGGFMLRYVDANNFIMVLPLRQPIQPNSDEIELIEYINGPGTSIVTRKVNVGLGTSPYFVGGVSHDLKVQIGLDDSGVEIMQVWLDGEPRITYPLGADSPAGTRVGFAHNLAGYSDFTTFDNWVVKAIA